MKKLVLRLGLLTVLALLFAIPAAATEYPTDCEDCITSNDGMMIYCDHPQNNSWGYEGCRIITWRNIAVCRREGAMCYYFEVWG